MYKIDQALSKRWSQAVALCVVGLWQVGIGGVLYAAVWRYDEDDDPRHERDLNRFSEGIWESWTFMSDPGTHAKVYRVEERLISSLLTIGGIIFFAAILGVVVDLVREKMENLRKGRSKVIERGHSVILGWTDKTILLIQELCMANESEGGGVIVVLAPEPKQQMETDFNVQLPSKQRLGSQVVFRSGTPMLVGDLLQVSADKARSVILLADGGDPDVADANILRAMLSLRSLGTGLEGFVVAECRDVDNEPLVKLVGGSVVETIVSHDVLGRMMLMSARQPGLAKVYEALLGFDGDEFYVQSWPELVGLKFGEIAARFPDAVPIGIRTRNMQLHLKASADHVIEPGDEILVIAEDKNSYKPEKPVVIELGTPVEPEEEIPEVEKIFFCGWRRDIRDILWHLDSLVVKGTEVVMMSHSVPVRERNARLLEEGLDVSKLENIEIIHESGNTSVRRKLEALPIEDYTSCLIFADQLFEADKMHADSHSLATLLLIRDIQLARGNMSHVSTGGSKRGRSIFTDKDQGSDDKFNMCPMICEILDQRTQSSIEGNTYISRCSDFCQSNRLVAQILAMISEERTVKSLLDELLGGSGCNVAVYSSKRYCTEDEECSFFTICERARLLDEIVFGYQMDNSIEKTVLNPSGKDEEQSWDRYSFAVIVGTTELARDRTESNAEDGSQDSSCKEAQTTEAARASLVGKEARSSLRDKAREQGVKHFQEGCSQTVISYPRENEGAVEDGGSSIFGSASNLETKLAEVLAIATGTPVGNKLLRPMLNSYVQMSPQEQARFNQSLESMRQFALLQAENSGQVDEGMLEYIKLHAQHSGLRTVRHEEALEKSLAGGLCHEVAGEVCQTTCAGGLCPTAAGHRIE